MRYLTLGEVVALGGTDLHTSVAAKASALAYSLALNHPFIDGNKRVAHAAMEVFLALNGYELNATVEEQEQLMLAVAAGRSSRVELERWLDEHIRSDAERS